MSAISDPYQAATPGHRWVEASNAEDADLFVHICRRVEDEIARVGPGLGGRWWVLLGPRRDPTPPHSHQVAGYSADPTHPARCRSPRCWTEPVLTVDGKVAWLPDPRR